MVAIIEDQRESLEALCRKHYVRRLEVFGSAADGRFDPDKTDLDFLVQYQAMSPPDHYEAYFGLWEDLQALFQRKVDLVEPHTLRNPYLISAVNESRKVVFTA